MKIAIVGPEENKWLPSQKAEIQKQVNEIINKYSINDVFDWTNEVIFISGRCPKGGVDIWAEEVADTLGCLKQIFEPKTLNWPGYKARNIKIAKECDILYCIVPEAYIGFNSIPYNPRCYCKHCKVWRHPSNGGCWTMKYAEKLGKEVHLIVIKTNLNEEIEESLKSGV